MRCLSFVSAVSLGFLMAGASVAQEVLSQREARRQFTRATNSLWEHYVSDLRANGMWRPSEGSTPHQLSTVIARLEDIGDEVYKRHQDHLLHELACKARVQMDQAIKLSVRIRQCPHLYYDLLLTERALAELHRLGYGNAPFHSAKVDSHIVGDGYGRGREHHQARRAAVERARAEREAAARQLELARRQAEAADARLRELEAARRHSQNRTVVPVYPQPRQDSNEEKRRELWKLWNLLRR